MNSSLIDAITTAAITIIYHQPTAEKLRKETLSSAIEALLYVLKALVVRFW